MKTNTKTPAYLTFIFSFLLLISAIPNICNIAYLLVSDPNELIAVPMLLVAYLPILIFVYIALPTRKILCSTLLSVAAVCLASTYCFDIYPIEIRVRIAIIFVIVIAIIIWLLHVYSHIIVEKTDKTLSSPNIVTQITVANTTCFIASTIYIAFFAATLLGMRYFSQDPILLIVLYVFGFYFFMATVVMWLVRFDRKRIGIILLSLNFILSLILILVSFLTFLAMFTIMVGTLFFVVYYMELASKENKTDEGGES